jgi:hypothetical protein
MSVTTQKTGPGKFTIGETDSLTVFEHQVISITLEPDVKSDDDQPVLSGEIVAGADTETWTVKGTLLGDFGSTESLQEFCFTNAGTQMPFTFTPLSTAGKQFSGVLKVRAVPFGGDVGDRHEADFEFPVVGRPTLAPVAP